MNLLRKSHLLITGSILMLSIGVLASDSNIAASFNVQSSSQWYSTGVISISNKGSQDITLNSKVTITFKSKAAITESRIINHEPLSWVQVDLNSVKVSDAEYSNTLSFEYTSNSWINNVLKAGSSFGILIAQGASLVKTDISDIKVSMGGTSPVANNISKTTQMNTVVDIDVISEGMCTGNGVKLDSVTSPQHGEVNRIVDQTNTNLVRYTPANGFVGQDSFSYTIIDQDGATASANVLVTVSNPYSAPVTQNAELTVNQDTAGTLDLSGKVTDGTSPYTYQVVSQPADGTADFNNSSTLSFTPNTGFSGTDSLTYKVIDANSQTSNVSTVTITVKSTDEHLTANNLTKTVTVNGKLEYDLSNLVSGGTSPYTFQLIGNESISLGSLVLNGSTVHFTSNGSTGEFTVQYKVTDQKESTAEATITIKVTEASSGDIIIGGYWENWKGAINPPVSDVSSPEYYANDIKNFNIIYYSFLTLAKSPNPDNPPDALWDGLAIYESMTAADILEVMGSYDKPYDNPHNWQRIKIDALISQCSQNNTPFVWAIGGWSDLTKTISDAQIDTFVTKCVELLKLAGDGIDFDWEHLSEDSSIVTQQRATLGKVMYKLRVALDKAGMSDKLIGYTTRFNAFYKESPFKNNPDGWASDGEGIDIDNTIKDLGSSLDQVVDWVNIMMYDVPPTLLDAPDNAFTLDTYKKILGYFEQYVSKNKIVMGFEPGFQAANGNWEGMIVDKEVIDYIKANGYGGIMFWAVNDTNKASNSDTYNGQNAQDLAAYANNN
ncbi:MAG: hypothetical protein GY750_04725 [Lentisphaerae bacterium]|nr:hypothetical protein [Lentisphaerota bacterium]MCP4100716.1 hypothetical protein [Lentisphaerota bacterium]